MATNKEKQQATTRFISRLAKITAALEVLVDIQTKEEFLETFQKLHAENVAKYREETK
jgi:hypothetical protein